MPLVSRSGFDAVPPMTFHNGLDLPDGIDLSVDLENDVDASRLAGHLDRIALIRIRFPGSADGRGFSLAQRLRGLGYRGRLRARGHVVSDQFRYALACGFDEVEIDETLAARQPEAHWLDGLAPAADYRDKLAGRLPRPAPDIPDGFYSVRVTEVRHYTSKLFTFRVTRPAGFRFRSGEFVMIGLANVGKPVYRAYSIATPSWDEELKFYSIKVPDGPLTKHLQRIVPGDTVLIGKKPTGTLVLDALTPGRRLYLFSTGTGIAPFASLIRDPESYEKFDEIVLTHTCRTHAELAYGRQAIEAAFGDPLVGALAKTRLRHYATTTQEQGRQTGRITTLIETGQLFRDLANPALDPASDRAMICGSLAMVGDTRALLEVAGLVEGSNNRPGSFVVERAFVG